MTKIDWSLECSNCSATSGADGLRDVCPECGDPWLVVYDRSPKANDRGKLLDREWNMWRYREWMPLAAGEEPVTLGEGMTPLMRCPSIEQSTGVETVWVKDEGQNPCGSFKSRGLSAAVTRATLAGAESFVIPTAGNAGVALAAYGQRSGRPVRVYAPRTTPAIILQQIRQFGAQLELLDGHIGDCGKAARAHAKETGACDVSTLREPYRIEGKKTMGIELAEQMGWSLPDCILYPTGGGTGLIGMWKAFKELRGAGWITGKTPRMFSVQAAGCQPVVDAFTQGKDATEPWPNPQTVAAGLRVPSPLGGKIILKAIRETDGDAVAVTDEDLTDAADRLASREGIDACPEGGATVVALQHLVDSGRIDKSETVVLYNTGAGWLYR